MHRGSSHSTLHIAERQIFPDYAAARTVRCCFSCGDISARYGTAHQLHESRLTAGLRLSAQIRCSVLPHIGLMSHGNSSLLLLQRVTFVDHTRQQTSALWSRITWQNGTYPATGSTSFSSTMRRTWTDVRCVWSEVFSSQGAITDAVSVCRALVGHFFHSTLAKDELEKLQATVPNTPCHALIQDHHHHPRISSRRKSWDKTSGQDVQRRWNSTYLMLQRLIEQRRPLVLYAAEHGMSSCRQLIR